MGKQVGVMAVPGSVDRAGALTYWTLSGYVDWVALTAEWQEREWDEELLPSLPSATTCLRRALRELETPGQMLQKLPGGGWAMVKVTFAQDDDQAKPEPEYTTLFKAWLDNEIVCTTAEGDLDDHIDVLFTQAKTRLDAHDLSGWLVDQAYRHEAVALRETGGIYFIPEHRAEEWDELVNVIGKVSHSCIYELPALKTEKAVAAVLDALMIEAKAEAEKLDEILKDEKLGTRGLRGRAARCNDMTEKIGRYESLLGVKLEEMRSQFTELAGRVELAIMQLDEGDVKL